MSSLPLQEVAKYVEKAMFELMAVEATQKCGVIVEFDGQRVPLYAMLYAISEQLRSR